VTATGDLTLDSVSDEAAPVPLEPIHFLEETRRQRDGDSIDPWHNNSMTHSMIILNGSSSEGHGREAPHRKERTRNESFLKDPS